MRRPGSGPSGPDGAPAVVPTLCGVELNVGLDGGRDLSGRIYRQIRAAVLNGRLRPGQELPSTRELATRLAVSRNTIGVAYDAVGGRGLPRRRAGAGTHVSEQIAAQQPVRSEPAGARLRPGLLWDSTLLARP